MKHSWFGLVVAITVCNWSAYATPPTSNDFLRQADDLLAAGQTDRAIDAYGQAIHLRLDDPDAWFGRGKALTAADRFRDAIDDFDQAIRLRPGFLAAHLQRGFAYGQAGDFERGIQDLDRVLAAQPLDSRALALRGEARERLGRLSEALDDYSSALSVAPGNVRVLLARSHVYTLLGQDQEALDDRNRAVQLAPQNPEVYLARGGSLHQTGLHQQGLADRTEAIRLKPDFAEAWYARGSAYFLLGDYHRASQDLEEALRLKPDYSEARGVLEKTKTEIAKEALGWQATPAAANVASPKSPESTDTPVLRQHSYLRSANTRPASETTVLDSPSTVEQHDLKPEPVSPMPIDSSPSAVSEIAGNVPVLTVLFDTLPQALASLMTQPAAGFQPSVDPVTAEQVESGSDATPATSRTTAPIGARNTESIKVSQKIVASTLKPSDLRSAEAHNQRGRELMQQGKYREAIDELSAALALTPDFAMALNARGFTYLLLKDWPHATADLDAALHLDPNYANAYHNRAVVRRAMGDTSGSRADEAKSQELLAKK